ncbi:stage II sporulation protein R [Viridibacillus arvi]|uniref:stage II sporulation protein R n=1 Tax=Viridibacillus arvi TaxID=263475 RepID=UPI00187B5949|nr:stage II sporulation protein R [Viridibacillus sp. JNUCC-6]QOV10372.1 stage II sporulation protein R [Viridibacillus sp. JNUCC-6]
MIPDYKTIEMPKQETKTKMIPVLQFIAALLFIQTLIFLLPQWFTQDTSPIADADQMRFRIVANSNSTQDQLIKQDMLKEIEPIIKQLSVQTNGTEMDQNLAVVEQEIQNKLSTKFSQQSIQVSRKQELFPAKRYEGFLYPQNYYDALVVTIGSGKGDNWWCALFPKVCYREEEPKKTEETKEETQKFFIWEWLKDIFS